MIDVNCLSWMRLVEAKSNYVKLELVDRAWLTVEDFVGVVLLNNCSPICISLSSTPLTNYPTITTLTFFSIILDHFFVKCSAQVQPEKMFVHLRA